jgi:UDP-N-acetyl-2-amino-2-deoxyglucuronate dehydrogenase
MSLKFGILGCGNIAKTHISAIAGAEGGELVAVCDEILERASALGTEFDVEAFSDFDLFLAKIDVLVICLPSGLHADFAVRAAQKGKHVLTEKPLDITLENGMRMVLAAEKAGVKLGCISQHRFARDVRQLYKNVKNGDLGRIMHGDACIKWYRSQGYYDSAGWRGTFAMDGGGCLMNQGVHYIDLIQWIMGGVKSVQAQVRTAMHNIEVEDCAMAMVEYNNGAMGVIQGSTAFYPGISERLEVHGTKGTTVIESDRAKIRVFKPVEEHEPFGSTITFGKEHIVEEDETLAQWNILHQLQIRFEKIANRCSTGAMPLNR